MFGKERPTLTVDVIIPDPVGHVWVARRGHKPFQGEWCLPGGKVDAGESVQEAACREAREELGLSIEIDHVLGIYSTPGRDPRGSYISIALVARPTREHAHTSEEATEVKRIMPGEQPPMAFDHQRILADHWRSSTHGEAVIA